MSHRALIAIEKSRQGRDGVYDLYFSNNGGERLVLKPVLEAVLSHDEWAFDDLPGFGGGTKQLLEEAVGDHEYSFDETLVQPSPIQEGVPESTLGELVNYIHHEAVFVCRDTDIDVYLPVFVHPDVLRPFREHVSLYAWPSSEISANASEIIDRIDSGAPIQLSGSQFSSIESGDDESVSAQSMFEVGLPGLLQNLYSVTSQEFDHEEAVTQLWTDEWVIACVYQAADELTLWNPTGTGILVRIPDDNHSQSEIYEVYRDAMRTANQLRLESSQEVAVSHGDSLSQSELQKATARLTTNLLQTFNYDVSRLSPDPFRTIIEKLHAHPDGSEYQ